MDEETKRRIINEVKKSGHPTSIKSSYILNKSGWFVKNSPRYFDREIKKYRELDILAQKNSFLFQKSVDYLLIECKKNSSCPWIFFKQKRKNRSVYTLNIAETTEGRIYDALKKNKIFEKHPYYDKNFSTYYFVGYKNQGKEEGREIDVAINQTTSALYFYINQLIDFAENNNQKLVYPSFYYPLIVFEGDLFEVEIDGVDIEVNETNHVSLLVEQELKEPAIMGTLDINKKFPLFSKQIIIDIVKLDYLEEYLKNLKLKNKEPINKDDPTN